MASCLVLSPARAQATGTGAATAAKLAQPQTPAQRMYGDIAPKFAEITDNVLYADVWERPGLSKRDRSLITVSALVAMNRPDQLRSHLQRARDNGLSEANWSRRSRTWFSMAAGQTPSRRLPSPRKCSRENDDLIVEGPPGPLLARPECRLLETTMNRTRSISRRHFIAPCALLPLAALGAPLSAAADTKRPATSRVLVAYFSRSGNTRVIAGCIGRSLVAEVFEIQPAQPYPEDYFQTVEQARSERDNGVKPPLKGRVARLDAYDAIYLGFPIWGETAPPVIRSFLAAHDLAGKILIPFITHGGFGVGDSLKVIAAHAPQARLQEAALVMQADQERQTTERVSRWLSEARPDRRLSK